MRNRKITKPLSALLAAMLVIVAMPLSAFAAVASDLPENMVDSHILRALEYTGYDVQAQKNDGTLYQANNYGSRTPSNILSDISYGTSNSGKENVADGSTVSGRAPNISLFESKGLCCAAFVTYFICNYLPFIEGVDTSLISNAVDMTGQSTQSCGTWQTALNGLVGEGKIEKIGTSPSNVDRGKLTPGDLIIFGNSESSHTHIAVYSGTYKGADYIIHVGNDRGPEISRVDLMSQAGDKSSYPNAYYHLPVEYWADDGSIEVYKKDTDGKALSGAVFIATEATTGQQYRIGPTDSAGYAKSEMPIPYGVYNIVESVFPTNYRAYGTSSWTEVLNKGTPNATITIQAVNEIIPGNCKIVKTSEDGNISGIAFTITGNGVNKTVKTGSNGEIVIDNLRPGSYTIAEQSVGYYEPQQSKAVTVVSGQTVSVSFNNVLKRSDLKVIKTSEDAINEGVKFRLYGRSASGQDVDRYAVTNKNGVAMFKNVLVGTDYTLEEIETAERYIIPDSQVAVIEWGKVTENDFYNQLKRGDLKVTKTSEDNAVEGIKFRLYGTSLSGHEVDRYAVTNKNGVAMFEDVLIGSRYTLEEVNVAEKYIAPKPQTVEIEWNKVANKSFENILKRGSLRVLKTSEDNLAEGLRFHLYGISLSGIKVDEYATTDKRGVATFKNILIGSNYTIEEVNTPIRYVVPKSQTVDIKWNSVTEKSFENILKKWRVDVFKLDSELADKNSSIGTSFELFDSNSDEMIEELGGAYGKTQGDATLGGAVYGVYKGETLVDTYTTDGNGYFITDYYVCGDDWSIREITPSEGYLLDKTIYHIDCSAENYTLELNTKYPDVFEDIVKGNIAIIKHTDDGSTKIETPEAGAKFEIFLKSAGSYENAKETERDIIVCDENGFGQTQMLPYGVYTVHQVSGWDGRDLVSDFEVYIAQSDTTYRYLINNANFESYVGVVKVDVETGKTIPYAGAAFQIYNSEGELVKMTFTYPTPTTIDTFYTDVNGSLVTPEKLPYGKGYSLVEVRAPFGYVLDTAPVYFDVTEDNSTGEENGITVIKINKANVAQKGTIAVTKRGEVFSSVTDRDGVHQPVYEIKGLAGAVYEITAAEDIVTLDGTIRYTKGEVVDTITTGEDGMALSCELYLGKYQISEITAPFGMVLNGEKVDVELVYAGQEIAVTNTSASFINERQKVEIDLVKNLEIDELFGIGNNGEISKVQFGLYAAEDMTAGDGKVIPKDGLIETAYCDENGKIAFVADLPVEASVYVKEIAADAHYILFDTAYPVVFEYAGQDIETVKISVNGGAAIENKIIRGNIVGKKLDEDGFAICGALFGLFRENETEFTEDTALLTCESNEIGVFLFENTPYGRYVVREIKAAPAFVLNENGYAVTVSGDGETVEIVIENRFIVGSVQTTKVDKDYPENKLTGAVFEIYVDVDGDGEFNAETDKLVGEMTEVETGVYRMDNLRYNGYFLYEKTAPEFFNKDDGYCYFEITADGETVLVENEAGIGFVNTAKVGSLKIVKTSSDGVVEGFSFRVTGTNGYDEVFTTDTNGEIIIENLRIDGEYMVSEGSDEKNVDYILPEDKTAAVIEGSVTIVEMHNERKPEPIPEFKPESEPTSTPNPEPNPEFEPEVSIPPKTGDNSNLPLWFGLMGLSGTSLVSVTLYNRKRRREEM